MTTNDNRPSSPDDLLSVPEMCDVLRCSRTGLYRYVRTGELAPPVRIGVKSYWFRSNADDFKARLREQQLRLIDERGQVHRVAAYVVKRSGPDDDSPKGA